MTGRGRSAVAPVAVIIAALAAPAPAATVELWRAEAEADLCRLELVNELAGVRIAPGPPEGSSLVVRGADGLALEPAAGARSLLLTVVGDALPDDAPADVEILVPRGCDVTVRTTGGEVTLEVAREAFSAAVQTVTGDITAWIDPAADASVGFATSGEITTDFKVEIDFRYHQEPAKHGQLTLITDAPRPTEANQVQLTSRRGAVRMLRPTTRDRHRPTETPDGQNEDD